MARKPRLFVTGIPNHVVQRGNNKNPIFFSNKDYFFFLEVLKEARSKYPCFIYGYCLMPNHFHLLIQPKAKHNISMLIKFLGAKYVRYINKIYKRSGTLWEGRFKSSLVDKERYFLACLRYIELNPVRAGIVNSPGLYQWSSYRFRARGILDPILDLDAWYFGLSSNPLERQAKYRKFVDALNSEKDFNLIREMTKKNGLIGGEEFRERLEKLIGIKLVFRPPGRPAIAE